ncbi:MAG: DNA-directed RNA polymerase subunit beta' [Chloroflexi bacterium]|nr:DNA-directed RNA polymerase subunit beta' [Chloroflexota bacterium]
MEPKSLRALKISLASPDQIKSWSYGEVLKPETINYRRLRPEKDGLFCEAIFGPTKDWQCYCGKYKNVRYKGIICDKCGVEVTRSSVRRERMGHIELAAPVAHVWYTRRVPSYLGVLLDVSRRNLDRVLYFAQYVITHVDEDARQKALKRLDEEIQREEKRQADEINAKIVAAKGARDKKISDLKAKIDGINEKYEADVAEKVEPLVKEGQKVQKSLEDKMDTTIRKPIDFEPTKAVIADEGETISRKHLTALNKAVQARLGEIETALKEKRDVKVDALKMDVEKVKAEAEDQIVQLRNSLEDVSAGSRKNVDKEREELISLHHMMFLGESKYRELKQKWGQVFKADMGAEAFHDILRSLDLDRLGKELWHEVRTTKSKQRKKKAIKRLKVVEALRRSGNRPEWMILTILPVIPPDLRPMVQLDGGRFATSDLNDLYRRVINRNNRLKRLLELGAPDVIVRNEKRMLQEAVDSLIDNSQRGKALSRRGRRELKSLSDMLKGKKGRFRRNLLGKRVDYSGRSVIVVGAKLKLHQCGLPRIMALELYRPFVIAKLVEYNFASNVKGAKRIIEKERPEVWEVLEEVIKDRPVLLNRAPTLHRLGIQAFEPVLVEGKAIHLHPLACSAFNADFDGDQMAIHIPLSRKAVEEARTLMLSTQNLLKPADGEPVVGPAKDMVLGVYYLTMLREGRKGEGRVFGDLDEVEMAYSLAQVDIHAKIKLYLPTHYNEQGQRFADSKPRKRLIETSVGRALFNRVLPEEMRFVNDLLDKSGLQKLVTKCYQVVGSEVTTEVVDQIKNIGFAYATRSGTTIAVSDLSVPAAKAEIVGRTEEEVAEVEKQFRRGLLTEQEQTDRVIELWTKARDEVAKAVSANLDPTGSLAVMAKSGATKGGFSPITQLAGMRGLMADPSGRIIPLPIRSNFREGLRALEYFISTHGARKGLADTALRTADAGYLTRRLVDVAQDLIVNSIDCGTEGGAYIRRKDDVAGQTLYDRILGRMAAAKIVDPKTGELLVNRNEEVSEAIALKIQASSIDQVFMRSPLHCQERRGICAMCYGRDLGRGKLVEVGSAVGIVAAQSIGEPGTQLTLRTFHTGGVAAGGDITSGLPRVEELFEARKKPKGEAVVTDIDGIVEVIRADKTGGSKVVKVVNSTTLRDEYEVPGNWAVKVEDGEEVPDGALLAQRGDSQVLAEHGGKVKRKENSIIIIREIREEQEYDIPTNSRLLVVDHQEVRAGESLTEGSQNPHRILRILGREACELYFLTEMQKVYRSQGQNINDKHFEVIVRKMLSRVQIVRPGDTNLLPGELIDRAEFKEMNEKLAADGKQTATSVPALLGVTRASLATDSFLSASSFQHTIKVLAGAAIEGKSDGLFGLKENVIIGKLIPAGTGYWVYHDKDQIEGGAESEVATLDEPTAAE